MRLAWLTASVNAAWLVALGAHPLVAQRSPTDDLLRQAVVALSDLSYGRADSLARRVLEPTMQATNSQRTRARVIIAATLYPEERRAQKRTQAAAMLRDAMRTNLGVTIPRDVDWPGLDSLLAEVKRNNFGIDVDAEREQVSTGVAGAATMRVRSNRAGTIRLAVTNASGAIVASDSAKSTTAAAFVIGTVVNGKPLFASGDYRVLVSAIDDSRRDTVVVRFPMRADLPPLALAVEPRALDSSAFLPDRTAAYGGRRGALVAMAFGGATYALASMLRADSVRSVISSSGKGVAGALAIGGAISLAALTDRGRPIPENVAANERLRSDHARVLREVAAANREKLAGYRTRVILDLEAR